MEATGPREALNDARATTLGAAGRPATLDRPGAAMAPPFTMTNRDDFTPSPDGG